MDPDELADELQRQYDACKAFPEYQPSGRMALIELRNLVPAAIDFLRSMGRQRRR